MRGLVSTSVLPLIGLTTCLRVADSWDTELPEPPTAFELEVAPIKQFEFHWAESEGARYYQLLESVAEGEPFVQVGADILGLSTSRTVPLFARVGASYVVRACNDLGCTDSDVVEVAGTLTEAIGYFKASNTGMEDFFGIQVSLADDGATLAVGAYQESSDATGVGGDQGDGSYRSGAAYVFVRDHQGKWTQDAYIKASNTGAEDKFGIVVSLSGDGKTLAVGAPGESSQATGVGGDQSNDAAWEAGAAYVFVRTEQATWTQQAYIKASNTDAGDYFGNALMLSDDGRTLAVGAHAESSSTAGIDGDSSDNSMSLAGAVYVYARDDQDTWTQQAYVKASNPGWHDVFGVALALSGDGDTLAVGAPGESSNAIGIDGDPTNDSAPDSGAAYVFGRDDQAVWTQRAYVKASNTDVGDDFGRTVSLSSDGSVLAVGATYEASNATGVDGDQADDGAAGAGAAYVFVRSEQGEWGQQAYLKASNTDADDWFGVRVALASDGNTLLASAFRESSSATGIDGDQTDDSLESAGAGYVFVRDDQGAWSQQAYLKSSSPSSGDQYGYGIALAGDASTLAIGSYVEASSAVGIGGDPTDDSVYAAGAVYLY
ncbi:integrin [Nannocystaceae bacterium ST9]